MEVKVIGVDPHKRSHTAVVLDDDEEIASQLRVAADRRQVERLVNWAEDWPERIWAVENANGLGRLLSQQLVMAGEQVVDVPASLSHRTRRLSGESARKTDEHDARWVAIAAAHPGRLRGVELENFSEALGMILDRRRHLVTFRHRTICRLHALLAEMVPGGASRQLTPVKAHGTSLTDIFGIGDIGAATILTIVGDINRFTSAGHFAAYNGTAPIEASSGDRKRHRLNRRGNRRLVADARQREVARGRQTGTRLASA